MTTEPKIQPNRQEEIEKQKRKRRTKVAIQFLIKILIVVAVIGGIIGLGFVLDRVGYTRIKEIYVTDYNLTELKLIDPEALSAKLLQDFDEDNYFLLSPKNVEKKIKELTTYTKNIYVSKLFPDAIKVEIVERRPKLIVSQAESCVVLDSEAYVLELVETELTDGATIGSGLCPTYTELDSADQPLLLVSDEINTEFTVGESSSFYVLDNLITTEEILNSEGYIVEKVLFTDNLYSFYLEGGKIIIMSDHEDFENQHKRLIIILREIASKKIDFETLDVSYERPVITR